MAETKEDAYVGSPGYSGETSTMSLIENFLLLISALIVGAFFTVWTVQRASQIALLKALGASSSYVVRDALGQMAIVLVSTAVAARSSPSPSAHSSAATPRSGWRPDRSSPRSAC